LLGGCVKEIKISQSIRFRKCWRRELPWDAELLGTVGILALGETTDTTICTAHAAMLAKFKTSRIGIDMKVTAIHPITAFTIEVVVIAHRSPEILLLIRQISSKLPSSKLLHKFCCLRGKRFFKRECKDWPFSMSTPVVA